MSAHAEPSGCDVTEPVWHDDFATSFEALLAWRRDVRHFRPDPVPETVVEDLVRLAALAPSVGNSQPWRFIDVRSAAIRTTILGSHRRANAAAGDGYDGAEAERYAALKLAGLAEAPVHLAVFCDDETRIGRGLGRRTMPETLRYSVVCAIHTLWLAARLRGLGVGWVSILEPEIVREALDVPPAWSLVAYLCLGYPQAPADMPELDRLGWQARLPAAPTLTRR